MCLEALTALALAQAQAGGRQQPHVLHAGGWRPSPAAGWALALAAQAVLGALVEGLCGGGGGGGAGGAAAARPCLRPSLCHRGGGGGGVAEAGEPEERVAEAEGAEEAAAWEVEWGGPSSGGGVAARSALHPGVACIVGGVVGLVHAVQAAQAAPAGAHTAGEPGPWCAVWRAQHGLLARVRASLPVGCAERDRVARAARAAQQLLGGG